MTLNQARLAEITVLKSGSHDPDSAYCLMEAVAYIAGESWSDRPSCVSPVLAAFGRAWNDGLRSDEERASLLPYIPLLIGTAGNIEADEERSWIALDWLIRVYAVAWLKLAGGYCAVYAARLAALPVIHKATIAEAQSLLTAARDAAEDPAWAATSDAAWAVAMAAARAAAKAATWDATIATAITAARAAVVIAARDALESTVAELQASAHTLFRRMIEVKTPS